jgi:transcriptional regulator with XRE-family HTH domain
MAYPQDHQPRHVHGFSGGTGGPEVIVQRGYSVYELATAASIFAGTIKRLECGKPADKRVLPALARALGVPVCRLVCGDHSCADRACVPARSVRSIAKR